MTKGFYDQVIDGAKNFDELHMIFKFLLCDFDITGDENTQIRRRISQKESEILLDMMGGDN